MRGIGPINIRMDPLQVEVAQQPSDHERIRDAIMRLVNQEPPAKREAINLIGKLGAERALELLKAGSGNGDGAAVPSDVPSADDTESHGR